MNLNFSIFTGNTQSSTEGRVQCHVGETEGQRCDNGQRWPIHECKSQSPVLTRLLK